MQGCRDKKQKDVIGAFLRAPIIIPSKRATNETLIFPLPSAHAELLFGP